MIWKSEVKIRTRTRSNRRRKWPKHLGWWRCGRYYVTGARRQEFEAVEWSENRPGVIGVLWQVAHELILADLDHFESLAWPFTMAKWYHWRHKCSNVQLISIYVWPSSCSNFDVGPLKSDSTEKCLSDHSLWFGVESTVFVLFFFLGKQFVESSCFFFSAVLSGMKLKVELVQKLAQDLDPEIRRHWKDVGRRLTLIPEAQVGNYFRHYAFTEDHLDDIEEEANKCSKRALEILLNKWKCMDPERNTWEGCWRCSKTLVGSVKKLSLVVDQGIGSPFGSFLQFFRKFKWLVHSCHATMNLSFHWIGGCLEWMVTQPINFWLSLDCFCFSFFFLNDLFLVYYDEQHHSGAICFPNCQYCNRAVAHSIRLSVTYFMGGWCTNTVGRKMEREGYGC